jgi:hypothetical protein
MDLALILDVLGKLKNLHLQEHSSTISHAWKLIERKDRFILTLTEKRGDKERKTDKQWGSKNSTRFPK